MISEKAVEAAARAMMERGSDRDGESLIWDNEHTIIRQAYMRLARVAVEAALSLHDAPVECNKEAEAIARLTEALKVARRYVDAVVANTPDKKKRRNYIDCLGVIDAALIAEKHAGGE